MTAAESSAPAGSQSITEQELDQCQRANHTGRPPVVFVHGLWLLPASWDRWAELFENNGFVALTPGWPDDPDTVAEAMAHLEVFAHNTVGHVADHVQTIIGGLDTKPAIIPGVTETVELKGPRPRPDHRRGWRQVADTALAFVQRFTCSPLAWPSVRA